MTKMRLLLYASLLLAIVVTIGVVAMLPPTPGVTKANFDRIQVGMTLKEVESIFGMAGTGSDANGFTLYYWKSLTLDGEGNSTMAAYCIFQDEGVSSMVWIGPERFPDKLRRWLHLD